MTEAGMVMGGSNYLEDAILTYRKALKDRRNRAERGTGEYRLNGKGEWLKM